MSTVQNQQITFQTCLLTHWRCEITLTLCKLFYGFNHRPPSHGWTRFHLGHGRPRPFEGGNFNTLQQNTHFWRDSTITSGKPLQRVWTTGRDHLGQFASKEFIELLKLLGIKSALSTAYHPQTDGTMERMNQEIEAYLLIYCASHPEDWTQALHTLEFTHNNRRHADRQNTPFELMFRESSVAIPLSFENTKYPTMEDKMKTLIRNREEALAAHELARSCMTDRRKSTFTSFKRDDWVWLDSWNLKTIYHKKMKPKQEGPFKTTEVLGPLTYWLQLPHGGFTTFSMWHSSNSTKKTKPMDRTSQNHHLNW